MSFCQSNICLNENDTAVKWLASVPLHCVFWNYLIYVPINSLREKWSLEKLNDATWNPEIVQEDQTVTPAGDVFFMLHSFCTQQRTMEEIPSLPSFPMIHLLPGYSQQEAGSQEAGGYPPFMLGWGHKGWRRVYKSGKEKNKLGIKTPRKLYAEG